MSLTKTSFFIPILFCLTLLSSCLLKDESPLGSSSDTANLIQSGDIVVANTGNDSIVLLNSDGTYKTTLYDEVTSNAVLYGDLTYDIVNNQVLWTYDHTTALLDSVKSFSLYDGTINTILTNSNLTGTLPGLARLTGGDLVILENTTTVEKFTADGVRSGAPLSAALIANTVQINPLSTGGFIVCSTATANTVRTYTAAAVLVSTATSASPAPSLGALSATGCVQNSAGQIIVAYSGAADTVRVYNSVAMTSVVWDFVDQNVLQTPGKIALRPNGNILVTDTGFNQIVEINPFGALVQVIGGAVLSVPNSIVVVP